MINTVCCCWRVFALPLRLHRCMLVVSASKLANDDFQNLFYTLTDGAHASLRTKHTSDKLMPRHALQPARTATAHMPTLLRLTFSANLSTSMPRARYAVVFTTAALAALLQVPWAAVGGPAGGAGCAQGHHHPQALRAGTGAPLRCCIFLPAAEFHIPQ
jgi:hypothetical protein